MWSWKMSLYPSASSADAESPVIYKHQYAFAFVMSFSVAYCIQSLIISIITCFYKYAREIIYAHFWNYADRYIIIRCTIIIALIAEDAHLLSGKGTKIIHGSDCSEATNWYSDMQASVSLRKRTLKEHDAKYRRERARARPVAIYSLRPLTGGALKTHHGNLHSFE